MSGQSKNIELTMTEMAKKLRDYPSYRIYYHKNPDGDAVMSAYALACALQSIGIQCEPVCSDPVPEAYTEFTANLKFPHLENTAAIAVDSADAGRLGKYADEKITLCIDHHVNNMEADYKYVVPEASSCSELIYDLIREMGIPVTKQIANMLYTGLVSDTQCFRAYSTTSASLKAAAALADEGAEIVRIARKDALEKTPERLAIEQVLLNSFHYTCDGRILGCMFTWDDLQRIGTDDSRLQGLSQVVDQVRGLEIGIVVRETRPGHCRISVRTYTGIDATKICAEFGGGGHEERSGFEIDLAPAEALERVERTAAKYIAKQ